MKSLRNEKGYFKFVLTVIILALCAYLGIQFGMPYYRYSVFKSDAKEITRISLGEVEKTKALLFERAQELKLPIEENTISVKVKDKSVYVSTSWSETVDLFGIYQKDLNFAVNIVE
jgi:hypothetical protein